MTVNEKVYCQIVGNDVTVNTCMMTQGQEGCFGCASPHRLCELCQKKIVTIPAIGMCTGCAQKALAQEQKQAFEIDRALRVDCQIIRFKISGAMCAAKQGEAGCAGCPAETRKCEECKTRQVRFPRYGLCLACSIKKFAGDLSLFTASETAHDSVMEPDILTDKIKMRGLYSKTVSTETSVKEAAPVPSYDRVRQLIAWIGKESKLAMELQSLLAKAQQLEDIQTQQPS